MKVILYILSFAMLALSSCKNADCPEGYDCIDDVCLCPDEKFELKGLSICKELEAGEYFGVSDCLFTDTLFVKFLTKDPLSNSCSGEIITSYDGGKPSTFSQPFIEQNDFDSLVSLSEFDPSREIPRASVLGEPRFYEDVTIGANFTGRLTEDRFEGNVEWRIVRTFHGDRLGELVESCPITLVTQK